MRSFAYLIRLDFIQLTFYCVKIINVRLIISAHANHETHAPRLATIICKIVN